MFCSEIMASILAKTREGPVETWMSRMASLIQKAGMDPAEIKWGGSPRDAAFSIYEEAKRRSGLAKLAEVLQ